MILKIDDGEHADRVDRQTSMPEGTKSVCIRSVLEVADAQSMHPMYP